MSELLRANRVAVKAESNGDGQGFVADFYCTHKAVASIYSNLTDWSPSSEDNKAMVREEFRKWAIENAQEFGINYDPVDRRAEGTVRKAHYTTDDELVDDAMAMVMPMLKELTEKCRYGIEWAGIAFDYISPKSTTASGADLSKMGIVDGKYKKSGDWAWANIGFMMDFKFKGQNCYLPITMDLVSGQLKKPNIGIQAFTESVKAEIIAAGIATESELDPPKEKSTKKQESEEQPKQESKKAEQKPKKESKPKKSEKVDQPKQESEEQPKRRRRSKKSEDK